LTYTERGEASFFLDLVREKIGQGDVAPSKRLLDHANQVRLHSAYAEHRTGTKRTGRVNDPPAGRAVTSCDSWSAGSQRILVGGPDAG